MNEANINMHTRRIDDGNIRIHELHWIGKMLRCCQQHLLSNLIHRGKTVLAFD